MTQRIQLQRVVQADAPALIAANKESQAHHLPWVTSFTDQAGFDAWFGRSITGPNVSLIARELDTGGITGVINISEIAMGAFQSAYLGYYGMVQYSRQGLMTQALRQAIAFAFTDLGLHRVEANIQPGNVGSIALVKKLGFKQEGFSERYLKIGGQWRDHERWALLADA
jgi:ribosomal-protein-alanine N-acetyltransferase